MIESDRLIGADSNQEDDVVDRAIRPSMLVDYVGQEVVCEQMEIFIQAAKQREEALERMSLEQRSAPEILDPFLNELGLPRDEINWQAEWSR